MATLARAIGKPSAKRNRNQRNSTRSAGRHHPALFYSRGGKRRLPEPSGGGAKRPAQPLAIVRKNGAALRHRRSTPRHEGNFPPSLAGPLPPQDSAKCGDASMLSHKKLRLAVDVSRGLMREFR